MIDVNIKIPLSFFFFFFCGYFFFSLFPAFGFFSVWGSKFQTLMTPRLDFSNWWAKDTCKGNPVVVTMENLNFSVVVLKKNYSHHSSNGKGERDLREGKKSSFSSTTTCLRPHRQQHAAQMGQNSELFFFFFNLFWLLIPLVWREKLCFVIRLGFVFCSNCDFVVHWEKVEILYAMLNSFFYSSCLILLVEEKEMKKMREC